MAHITQSCGTVEDSVCQICKASAAAEMLSPPPTVCTTCLHTSTGATQICTSMSTSDWSAGSRQHATGWRPVNSTSCSPAAVPNFAEINSVSRSSSLARATSTSDEAQVCRYAVSDAFATAAWLFGHSLLSASVTRIYTTDSYDQWSFTMANKDSLPLQ